MGLSHNKLYRNFIILQEYERGYSTSKDKALSGYAKVEAKGDKCKVSFYAQNLKPEENYSMVLICCKKDYKQLIDLGPLEINEVGKGDTSKEYYINNIAGIGISYEKISGAAICKTRGGETGFIMYGFMNGEELAENWRKFKLVKVDGKKLDSKPELVTKNIKVLNVDNKTIEKTTSKENDSSSLKIEKIDTNVEEKIKLEPEVDYREEIKPNEEIKKEEAKEEIQDKVNIEVKSLEREATNVEANVKESHLDVSEETDKTLSESDRNKDKKCNKYDDKDKECNKEHKKDKDDKDCKKDKEKKKYHEMDIKDKEDKEDNKDKEENKEYSKYYKKDKENKKEYEKDSIDECIEKLAEKLEDYEGTIDFDMELDGDFIVWGILKDKSIDGCKWKKFKVDKKHCSKCNKLLERQDNSRRIEENTRLDDFGFEEYERDIENTKDTSKFTIKGSIGNYFENLAKDFEPYNEKLNDINYCKWYKVNVNSIEDLCNQSNYNKYTLAYYPMLTYYPYINKNNHFLLGYKCDQSGELKYIVYGIPGSKNMAEQPFGGKTGFVTWTNDNTRNQGYWLMFYDYKNSSIVIPMK